MFLFDLLTLGIGRYDVLDEIDGHATKCNTQ